MQSGIIKLYCFIYPIINHHFQFPFRHSHSVPYPTIAHANVLLSASSVEVITEK